MLSLCSDCAIQIQGELIKEVYPGDSDSFSSGVSNSSFEQLLGEVTGLHVDEIYESQLSLGDVGCKGTGTNQALESCGLTSDREALDGTEDLTVGALKDVQLGLVNDHNSDRAIELDGNGYGRVELL